MALEPAPITIRWPSNWEARRKATETESHVPAQEADINIHKPCHFRDRVVFFVTFKLGRRLESGNQLLSMYRNTQSQDVVRLLLLLKTVEQDYPFRLMSHRRLTFVDLVYKYI